jgi:GTPase SAR1 family protein
MPTLLCYNNKCYIIKENPKEKNMATKVYESVELELLDGTIVNIKPLNLKNLRELMKEWQKAQESKDEDDFLNILINCTQIAFKQYNAELAGDREALENALDIQTMYKILEVAAEIKLNDPNLVAMAQELVGTN